MNRWFKSENSNDVKKGRYHNAKASLSRVSVSAAVVLEVFESAALKYTNRQDETLFCFFRLEQKLISVSLPGHPSHDCCSDELPGQGLPGWVGLGYSQVLVLVWFPPHVSLHSLQVFQSDHIPVVKEHLFLNNT